MGGRRGRQHAYRHDDREIDLLGTFFNLPTRLSLQRQERQSRKEVRPRFDAQKNDSSETESLFSSDDNTGSDSLSPPPTPPRSPSSSSSACSPKKRRVPSRRSFISSSKSLRSSRFLRRRCSSASRASSPSPDYNKERATRRSPSPTLLRSRLSKHDRTSKKNQDYSTSIGQPSAVKGSRTAKETLHTNYIPRGFAYTPEPPRSGAPTSPFTVPPTPQQQAQSRFWPQTYTNFAHQPPQFASHGPQYSTVPAYTHITPVPQANLAQQPTFLQHAPTNITFYTPSGQGRPVAPPSNRQRGDSQPLPLNAQATKNQNAVPKSTAPHLVAHELQCIQRDMDSTRKRLDKKPGDPGLEVDLKNLQLQLNSTLNTATGRSAVHNDEAKDSPNTSQNRKDKPKKHNKDFGDSDSALAYDDTNHASEKGGKPQTRRSKHGSEEPHPTLHESPTKDSFKRRLHHHICTDCGVVRSTDYHALHPRVSDRKPVSNLCTDCRTAKIEKNTMERYHFCFSCGRFRSKSFQEDNVVEEGEPLLPNYCGKCTLTAKATESLVDATILGSRHITPAHKDAVPVPRDETEELECSQAQQEASLASPSEGLDSCPESKRSQPRSQSKETPTNAKPRPIRLPPKLSPACETPTSPYFPDRSIGSAQRRAQRSPLLPIDEELDHRDNRDNAENKSPYKAPYVEESFSPSRERYADGVRQMDGGLETQDRELEDFICGTYKESMGSRPRDDRNLADPGLQGKHHQHQKPAKTTQRSCPILEPETDSDWQQHTGTRGCKTSDHWSPSYHRNPQESHDYYDDQQDEATTHESVAEEVGHGLSHEERTDRDSWTPTGFPTEAFSTHTEEDPYGWKYQSSVEHSRVQPPDGAGSYTYWGADEFQAPYEATQTTDDQGSRSFQQTGQSIFASMTSGLSGDGLDDGLSHQHTRSQGNSSPRYKPHASPFASASIFSSYGPSSEPRPSTTAGNHRSSWNDGVSEDSPPSNNPYYVPRRPFTSSSLPGRRSWRTRRSWETGTTDRHGSRLRGDAIPEPIIEEPPSRPSSPMHSPKLLEYCDVQDVTDSPIKSENSKPSTGPEETQIPKSTPRTTRKSLLLTNGHNAEESEGGSA